MVLCVSTITSFYMGVSYIRKSTLVEERIKYSNLILVFMSCFYESINMNRLCNTNIFYEDNPACPRQT